MLSTQAWLLRIPDLSEAYESSSTSNHATGGEAVPGLPQHVIPSSMTPSYRKLLPLVRIRSSLMEGNLNAIPRLDMV